MDAMLSSGGVQARPDGAQAAHDKRKWFEEKQSRQEADLARLGVGKADVSHRLLPPAVLSSDEILPAPEPSLDFVDVLSPSGGTAVPVAVIACVFAQSCASSACIGE